MSTTLLPEWDIYKTSTEMELDFWRGEHFRFSSGGFTNCWMLQPGDYSLKSHVVGCAKVSVTRGFHLTELEAMQDAGLGSVEDPAIAEWSFPRFCHLVDMRRLYVNGDAMKVDDLIGFIKATSYRRLKAGETIQEGDEVDASADGANAIGSIHRAD